MSVMAITFWSFGLRVGVHRCGNQAEPLSSDRLGWYPAQARWLLAMATRTVALAAKDLQGGIEALSSAACAFQMTPFERGAYRTLMVSVDVAAFSWVILWMLELTPVSEAFKFAKLGALVVFIFAVVVGTASLALNIPLLVKFYRETTRLKKLGLSSLSKSLWKESRRSRWISWARGALLILVGIQIFVVSALHAYFVWYGLVPTKGDVEWKIMIFVAPLLIATLVPLIFSARYLHNQHERMELIASAEELKKAFESLRQRAGKAEVVSVPSELLERAARIESAQIAKERKDAVLKSIAIRPSGYAITFDRDAAKERATLGVADRVELEDLVAQLSIEGAQFEPQGAEGGTLRVMTKSQRVEIVYIIDHASRGIRITAVRHGGGGSPNGL